MKKKQSTDAPARKPDAASSRVQDAYGKNIAGALVLCIVCAAIVGTTKLHILETIIFFVIVMALQTVYNYAMYLKVKELDRDAGRAHLICLFSVPLIASGLCFSASFLAIFTV